MTDDVMESVMLDTDGTQLSDIHHAVPIELDNSTPAVERPAFVMSFLIV